MKFSFIFLYKTFPFDFHFFYSIHNILFKKKLLKKLHSFFHGNFAEEKRTNRDPLGYKYIMDAFLQMQFKWFIMRKIIEVTWEQKVRKMFG